MRIHRYPIGRITDRTVIQMPRNGAVLSVAPGRMMPGTPAIEEHIDLWVAIPEDGKPNVDWKIFIVPTGVPVPEEAGFLWERYSGTAVMPSGMVWHVFAVRPKDPAID